MDIRNLFTQPEFEIGKQLIELAPTESQIMDALIIENDSLNIERKELELRCATHQLKNEQWWLNMRKKYNSALKQIGVLHYENGSIYEGIPKKED